MTSRARPRSYAKPTAARPKPRSARGYCLTCCDHHYFGFDDVGAPVELMTCRRGEPPPMTCVPESFNGELYYDAEDEYQLVRKAVRGCLKAHWEG